LELSVGQRFAFLVKTDKQKLLISKHVRLATRHAQSLHCSRAATKNLHRVSESANGLTLLKRGRLSTRETRLKPETYHGTGYSL
jgi:hypothetical protein